MTPARFQPWPEASLHSVARKFLDEADLGDDATRAAVVEFMPMSFAAVNRVQRREGALLSGACTRHPVATGARCVMPCKAAHWTPCRGDCVTLLRFGCPAKPAGVQDVLRGGAPP